MSAVLEPSDIAAALMRQLARSWWLILLRGIMALGFAAFCLSQTAITLDVLVWGFVVFAGADGMVELVAALWRAPGGGRIPLLGVEALTSIAASALASIPTSMPMLAFIIIVGLRAAVGGAMLMMSAARLANHAGHLWMMLAGLVSMLLTVALFIAPFAGVERVTSVFCAYLIGFGVLMVGLALQLRAGRR